MMESTSEYRASVAVWQYCPPALFAFGTFGNIMTVVILRRMNMKRSAMPVYLTALAVSDTCLLYTGLLRRWVKNVFQLDFRSLHSVACKMHTWLVYSFIIISAWILTFMTVERTLSVWRPHHVSLLCTRTKAAVIVVVIALTSLLVNCHLLYGVDLVSMGDNSTSMECAAPDKEYLYFFDVVWSWADLTLSSLIPFTVLLVGNCLILWKVSLSNVRAARYLGSVRNPSEVTQRKKKTSSMTVTLVALSVIFFLTTSPICVYNIIEHYVEEEMGDDPQSKGRLKLAWAVVNILMYTNSTVNFYLYCLSGAKFRMEMKRCLCCRLTAAWHPTKYPDLHTTTNASSHAHTYDSQHEHHQHCYRSNNQAHNHSNDPRCHSLATDLDRTNGMSLALHHNTLHLQAVLDLNHDSTTEF